MEKETTKEPFSNSKIGSAESLRFFWHTADSAESAVCQKNRRLSADPIFEFENGSFVVSFSIGLKKAPSYFLSGGFLGA